MKKLLTLCFLTAFATQTLALETPESPETLGENETILDEAQITRIADSVQAFHFIQEIQRAPKYDRAAWQAIARHIALLVAFGQQSASEEDLNKAVGITTANILDILDEQPEGISMRFLLNGSTGTQAAPEEQPS